MLFIPTLPSTHWDDLDTNMTLRNNAQSALRGALMRDTLIAPPSANGNTPYNQTSA